MSTKSNGETATDRPEYVTSRLRYFNGEFLATKDFIAEQNYHVDRQVRHQAQLHASGIQEGLDVTQTASQKDTADVTIGAGTALDDLGNQILISEPVVLSLLPDVEIGDYIVDLIFEEMPSDKQPNGGDSRFTQDPTAEGSTMLAVGKSLRDHAVPLARVQVGVDADGSKVINAVDNNYFPAGTAALKYAGVRLPGPTGNGATMRVQNISSEPDRYPDDSGYNPPNYKVTLDKSLVLNAASSGSSSLEIEQGALIFYGDGDIWSSGYNQRIQLHNDGVELLAHKNVTLTTNNADTDTDPIQTLVAYQSGAVGIGTGADEPRARLEVKGSISDPQKIHAADKVALNLQVSNSDGSALFTVADSGATTVSGPLTAQNTLEVTGLLTASDGLDISGNGLLDFGSTAREMISLFGNSTYGIGVQQHTVYFRSDYGFAFYQKGTYDGGSQVPGVGGTHVLAMNDVGDVIVSKKITIGQGEDMASPSGILEVHDAGTAGMLFAVGQSEIDASILLNANGGLKISSTQIDSNGHVMIGKSSGTPSSPLEIYDGSDNALLTVTDKEISASVVLKANQGLEVAVSSKLFGDWGEVFDSNGSPEGDWLAPSDGFIMGLAELNSPSESSGSGSIVITAGNSVKYSACVFYDATSNYGILSSSVTVPLLNGQKFTVKIPKGTGQAPGCHVYWIPIGTSVGLPSKPS